MKYSLLKTSWLAGLIFAVAATGGISRAADEKMPELKTLSGKTYLDVRITKVTPSEISIIHESGATRIPIADLPEEMKAKLGYDPAKADVHAKSVAAAEAAARKKEAVAATENVKAEEIRKNAKPYAFIVDEERDSGLVVHLFADTGNDAEEARQTGGGKIVSQYSNTLTSYFLVGVPNQSRFVEKALVGGLFVLDGTAVIYNGKRVTRLRFVGLEKKGDPTNGRYYKIP